MDNFPASGEERAPVCRILRHSAVDGPGNRAVLFVQGCNFDCPYCHNPETISLCDGCGVCLTACPAGALSAGEDAAAWDAGRCVWCDSCIKACPNRSSPRVRLMSPEEAFDAVRREIPFIRGVTASGGECTQYPGFLRGFFALCRGAGLSCFIDTNGSYDFSRDEELLALTDGVMPDIKAPPGEHARVAGAGCDPLPGAVFLAGRGKLYEVRTVVSPGLFDAAASVERACSALAPLAPGLRYKLIPYRAYGVRKEYAGVLRPPTPDELAAIERIVAGYGLTPVIV